MTPRTLLLAALALTLAACEDEVTVASGFAEAQPVVDAWLTTEPGEQTVLLTRTQDYYLGSAPVGITGARVRVCRGALEDNCVDFAEVAPGRYTYLATEAALLGGVGDELVLAVELPRDAVGEDEPARELRATTQVRRTAQIDSLAFVFEEDQLGLDSGHYAQLYATDPAGPGDRYLVRTWFNDTLLNRIDELTLVYDAGFDGGTTTDGIAFIFPIRFSINRRDDDGGFEPLVAGDSLYTEVWSLSPAAFAFLQEAQTQIQNGESQLFSLPVVNVVGNVVEAESGRPVLGVFNVSTVAAIGRRFGS